MIEIIIPIGTERTKLPVVSANGSELDRPRKVYAPHEIPAAAINAELVSGGAARPGKTR